MDSSQQNLESICDQIGTALALQASRDNPDDLMGKLSELTNLLGSSAQSISLAEQIYNEKLMQLVLDNRYTKLGATEKKMLFAGLAKKEISYVTLSTELNRSLMKGIESLRSMLSYLKAEMSNLPTN